MKATILMFGLALTLGTSQAMGEGQPFQRLQQQIDDLQQQIDELRDQRRELQFTFRDSEQTLVLAPGEEGVFALQCPDGQVIVTGGYTFEPTEPIQVTLNTLFFDGVHSGWRTDVLNVSDAVVTVNVRITQSCTDGSGIIG